MNEKQVKEAPPLPEATPDELAARLPSPNEPWGSNVGSEAAPPPELPLLTLTSVSPATAVVSADPTVPIAVSGSGFTADCVILFDDEELTTTFASDTSLTADAPMAASPAVVDVEVSRGEELSDVITFEFTAVAGRTSKEPERKPRKDTPSHKRLKKGKR